MAGIAGADAKCQVEFGGGWKALLVGGARRATVTPYMADGQQDWVVHQYTHYYDDQDQLVWRTDDVALLGVRNGARQNLYATFFDLSDYPWAGWAADWTTIADEPAMYRGTCQGWTSSMGGSGNFVGSDLASGASEPCGTTAHIMCVQQ